VPLHLVVFDTAIIAAFFAVVIVVFAVGLMVAVIVVSSVIRAGCGRHNSGGCMASRSDSRGSGRRIRQRGNNKQTEALGELAGRLLQEKVRLVRVAVANLLQQLTVLPLSISSGSTSGIRSSTRSAHGAHDAVERRDVGS
jgi:hypothetical protein